jgi:hypothetical protein
MPLIHRCAPLRSDGKRKELARGGFGCGDHILRHTMINDVEEAKGRAGFANFVAHAHESGSVAFAHAAEINEGNSGD